MTGGYEAPVLSQTPAPKVYIAVSAGACTCSQCHVAPESRDRRCWEPA